MDRLKILKNYIKVLCFTTLFTPLIVFSHGDLSLRIKAKSIQIKKDSTNKKLYFERGFLYQQHLEYDEAIKDYNKSRTLGYNTEVLFYRLAESYYASYQFENALESIQYFFEQNDKDVKAYLLRAKIYYELNLHQAALLDFNFFLKNINDLKPEDVILHSQIILSENPKNYNEAIASIDFGLQVLGENTLVLQHRKLELLEISGNNEAAIALHNVLILNSNRKEFQYFNKAKYLIFIEQFELAKITLFQAKSAIFILPENFKHTYSIKKLSINITKLEQQLN